MNKTLTRLLLSSLIVGCSLYSAQASSPLEALKKETQAQLQHFASGELRCFPELKSEAEAHIIYSYRGMELVAEGLGGNPPRYLDVRVEKTDKPVLLVFSAYDPIVWRVSVAQGANIAGVFMSGNYEQMVTGLPQGIPVTRTQYGFRNGKENEKCLHSAPEASEENAPKLTPEQAEAQFQKLRKEFRPMGNKVYNDLAKLGVYKEIREEFASRNADETFLSLIDEIIVKKTKEVEVLQAKAAEMQKRITDIADEFTNAVVEKKTEFDDYIVLNKATSLASFEAYLVGDHAISIADYHRVLNQKELNEALVISSENAQKYRDLKTSGTQKLSELEMPKFDLVDLDKPHLAAPSDYVAGGGLDYLVKQGYVLNDDRASNYHCEKVKALSASIGFVKKDVVCMGSPTQSLGPSFTRKGCAVDMQ